MRLTNFSDYALRMLMYTASAGGRLITIEEAARAFNVSKTHLNKVPNTLTRGGYLKAIRGRSGGLVLGRRPEMIRIGDVVRLRCCYCQSRKPLAAMRRTSEIAQLKRTILAIRHPVARRQEPPRARTRNSRRQTGGYSGSRAEARARGPQPPSLRPTGQAWPARQPIAHR